MRPARVPLWLAPVMLIVAIVAGSVAVARQVTWELWKPFDRPHRSQLHG
jgi:hypothetical protein